MNTLVALQTTRITKSFLAHIAFVRFLFRMCTHVLFQTTDSRKAFSHIAFVRFLVRVNTHVSFQTTRCSKTLLANIALVLPSLPLRSFLNKSRFFFSHLLTRLEIIVLVGILKHKTKGSSFLFFLSPPFTTLKTVLAFTARLGCGFFLRPICYYY